MHNKYLVAVAIRRRVGNINSQSYITPYLSHITFVHNTHAHTHTHTNTHTHTLKNWDLNRAGATVLENRWRRSVLLVSI